MREDYCSDNASTYLGAAMGLTKNLIFLSIFQPHCYTRLFDWREIYPQSRKKKKKSTVSIFISDTKSKKMEVSCDSDLFDHECISWRMRINKQPPDSSRETIIPVMYSCTKCDSCTV